MTAAVRYAAGGTAAALVPLTVAVLAEGASRAMILHRLMKWAAALLLIGVAAGGVGIGMLARSAPPEPERPAAVADDNRYRVTMPGRRYVRGGRRLEVPRGLRNLVASGRHSARRAARRSVAVSVPATDEDEELRTVLVPDQRPPQGRHI